MIVAESTLQNIEAAINRVCGDIKEKKAGSGSDKLESLSKLINSYSRLIERVKQLESDPTLDGDPAFYKRLTAEKTDMKGIIR